MNQVATQRKTGKLLAIRGKGPRTDNGIVGMVRAAARRENRLATCIGSVFGGFVPVAIHHLVHKEVTVDHWWTQPKTALIAAGLVYSAMTVVQWGQMAFKSRVKAVGFAALVEGVMALSSSSWLSSSALILLVTVNAVATGVTLSKGSR